MPPSCPVVNPNNNVPYTNASSPPRQPYRLRSTAGCLTCRQRRVKCDEGRNASGSCANCAKKSRSCRWSGGPPPPLPTKGRRPVAAAGPGERAAPSYKDFGLDATANATAAVGPVVAGETVRSRAVEEPPPPAASLTGSPVSPFLATLGSILLNHDATQDHQDVGNGQAEELEEEEDAVDEEEDAEEEERARDQGGGNGLGHHLQSQAQSTPPTGTGTASVGTIQLQASEIAIFRNYVDNISRWIDSFSHDSPFGRVVPVLALRCQPLLSACLALSAKQMVLAGSSSSNRGVADGGGGLVLGESDAVRYYRRALTSIRSMLLDPFLAQSDEVLAACIILSTYEMVDVVGAQLGSHLAGVASLLQSRQVHGDVAGIRGACFWTWYRHETWAALQTGQPMSSSPSSSSPGEQLAQHWEPPPLASFEGLHPEDMANRVIFLFGQCINFCNDDGSSGSGDGRRRSDGDGVDMASWVRARKARATALGQALDDWKAKLPRSMTCFSSDEYEPSSSAPLGEVRAAPGAARRSLGPGAVAHQVFHASKILLALHQAPREQPLGGGGGAGLASGCSFLSTRSRVERSRREVFCTANAGVPDAWSLVSTQCLFIADLVTEDAAERERTLVLIEQCQRSSGRKTGYLADDLRRLWGLVE